MSKIKYEDLTDRQIIDGHERLLETLVVEKANLEARIEKLEKGSIDEQMYEEFKDLFIKTSITSVNYPVMNWAFKKLSMMFRE